MNKRMAKASGGTRTNSTNRSIAIAKTSVVENRNSIKANNIDTKSISSTNTLKTKDISSFIRTQIGIDIEKYRDNYTREMDKRSYINIDTRNMTNTDMLAIERLGNSYGGLFKFQPNGVTVYSIRPIKRK